MRHAQQPHRIFRRIDQSYIPYIDIDMFPVAEMEENEWALIHIVQHVRSVCDAAVIPDKLDGTCAQPIFYYLVLFE